MPSWSMPVMVQVSRLATCEVTVVAAGHHPVSDAHPLAGTGDDPATVIDVSGCDETVTDRAVERRDLFAGVGHHQHTRLAGMMLAAARSASAWVRSASVG